jgi:hypothetical protein
LGRREPASSDILSGAAAVDDEVSERVHVCTAIMRRHFAIHEAGHAIVAIRVRLPFESLKLTVTEGELLRVGQSLGHTSGTTRPLLNRQPTIADVPRLQRNTERRIIAAYAGYHAERLYCPQFASTEGCEEDFERAQEWFTDFYSAAMPDRIRVLMLNNLEKRAIKYLQEPAVADALHRVAEVLLERGDVAYKDAQRIYLECKKPRSP